MCLDILFQDSSFMYFGSVMTLLKVLLCVLSFSCIVHFTDLHSDEHLGQRKAQSLQQGVQGLSWPSHGHYSPDSLTVVESAAEYKSCTGM